jgi:hypothetical protein
LNEPEAIDFRQVLAAKDGCLQLVLLPEQAEHRSDLVEADREISPTDRAEHRVRSSETLHAR